MNDKMRQFVRTYGGVGVAVHLTIGVLCWVGFIVAIQSGVVIEEISGLVAGAGTVFAAWIALKATSPIRWLVTVAITPAVVALWKKIYGRPPLTPDDSDALHLDRE